MKRLFKKNQIIIATLAVMIAIAGYLNYSGILFGENGDSTTEANADLANQELLDISEDDIESSTEDIGGQKTKKPCRLLSTIRI